MKNEFYIQWHITNQCRNRCKHCYQSEYDGESVSLSQADFILEKIKACCDELEAEPYIVITGGDPMENPYFFQILEKSLSISRRVGILGNPEQIIKDNGETARRLARLKISSYQVSLDGMEQSHDKLRAKGSFQRTLQAIKILSVAGIRVNVMSTVSKENYMEMVDVMKTSYKHGANFWTFTRYAPMSGGHCGIEPGEFLKFMTEIIEALKPYEAQGKPSQTREPLLCLVKEIEHPERLGGCGIGFSRLVLMPDNTVMACRRHPGSILGKVDEKHDLLWHFAMNPKMDEYRNFSKIEGCKNCNFLNQCRGCKAVAYLATANDLGDDPQCLILQEKRQEKGISDQKYFISCGQNVPFSVKCS
jgi:radical SAM protein with 4Fe4S-binding SPASM domain